MSSHYCKKRNEIIKFPVAEDYCVDCEYFDNEDCWVCDLEIRFMDAMGAKVLQYDFRNEEK